MTGDCHVRFCERLGGETPPCLLGGLAREKKRMSHAKTQRSQSKSKKPPLSRWLWVYPYKGISLPFGISLHNLELISFLSRTKEFIQNNMIAVTSGLKPR